MRYLITVNLSKIYSVSDGAPCMVASQPTEYDQVKHFLVPVGHPPYLFTRNNNTLDDTNHFQHISFAYSRPPKVENFTCVAQRDCMQSGRSTI